MLTPASGPAVAAAFGLPGDAMMTGPVARGEQGQVWRLETGPADSRAAYAVKDPFVETTPDDALADAAYQDLVRAAGVPMPAVLRTPDAQVLVEVDGSLVRLYDWVDVLPRDRRLDPAEVGALLAQIHRVVVPVDQPADDWYAAPVGAARWSELVGTLADAGAPFADDLAALVPRLLEVEGIVEPYRATQRCHLDLWEDNLLPGADGGLVVLDWENSGPGSPSQELGSALFVFGLEDPDRIRALHAAYVAAGGPGRVTTPGDLTMLVAQLGHITEIACRRWLDAPDEAERRHVEAWAREGIDEPVTLATVERIVDAVS
ncbi:aminoglycoside phosphotransferase family protein [Nocardioides bigeumensis]|uniref:Aminoglycoside phosphotransferase domain-containing protein n=1 Tax=Nocardioides bigeumensis TaxID=433657 RepID=A0ABN2XQ64_9ACTN